MTEPAWWVGTVVHQVYPRSFADSDGESRGHYAQAVTAGADPDSVPLGAWDARVLRLP